MKCYRAWVLEKNDHRQQEELIVIIPQNLFEEFYEWRQYRSDQTEACGIIYGERRGNHFLVIGITTPMLTDIRSRYSCTRNSQGHQQILNRVHEQSNGVIQYLGEWHTHPQKIAYPSFTDLREWKSTYEYLLKKQDMNKMLCLILGIDKDWLGVYQNGQLDSIHNLMLFNENI